MDKSQKDPMKEYIVSMSGNYWTMEDITDVSDQCPICGSFIEEIYPHMISDNGIISFRCRQCLTALNERFPYSDREKDRCNT